MAEVETSERVKEAPKSAAAEQAVIGALLLDNARWEDIAEYLVTDDFFYQNNRLIFQVISELANKGEPFDVLTISSQLGARDELEQAGGVEYLRQLGLETPSVGNAVSYARIVREQGIKRKLISAAGDIANSAYFPEGRDARDILDAAERKVFQIAEAYQHNTREGLQPVKKTAAEVIKYVEQLSKSDGNVTGIASGFSDLDEMTAGLQRGDLVVIAGRPSMGKTTFAMNIAENVALGTGLPVAIFSLEMPARALVLRMISSLGRVDNKHLRLGKLDPHEDMPKFMLAMQQLKEAPIFIDDSSSLSVVELRARARRLKRDHGELGLVLVDYLQLMQLPEGADNNRATQLGDISRALKLLAKEIDAPVVALSQLNRSLENRPDKRPIMSDIRESGAIEQDADVIMFVYRDEVYHKETENTGLAEIIIGKQRNGPIGKVGLAFLGQYTRFDDYSPRSLPEWEE